MIQKCNLLRDLLTDYTYQGEFMLRVLENSINILMSSSSSVAVTFRCGVQGSSTTFSSFSVGGQPLYFTPVLSTFIGLLFYSPLPGHSVVSISSLHLGDCSAVRSSQQLCLVSIVCCLSIAIHLFNLLCNWLLISHLPQEFICYHFWSFHF